MKSNNTFIYIFIIAFVILIGIAGYMIYNQTKISKDNNEIDNTITSGSSSVSIVDNLKLGISNYDTMNPLLTTNKEIINIDKIIFEPLINITSDYKTELCLATSFNKTSDITYEIKINTNTKWQDGTSLISKDIQFTVNKLKEIPSIYSKNVENILSVDTPDAETAVITLTQPVNFFDYNLTFPILSSSYYLNEDFQNSSKIPLGTGMYKIASIDENTILLIQNDRWRNIKNSAPKTKSISIKRFNSVGEIFNSFKLGNIDFVDTHMSNYTDYVGTMGYNKKDYKGKNYDFISINCSDMMLSDSGVRRAINYSINRDSIVSSVFGDSKYSATNPLDYGSYLYTNTNQISFNKETAEKELGDAGWIYTNNRWQKSINGYVRKLTLSLTVDSSNSERVDVANLIKEQLADSGISININKVSTDKYYEILSSKNYQLLLTGISNSVNPDLSYFYGSGNIANYNNDSIISKLNSVENYSEIQKIVNQDSPYIGLYRDKGTLLLNANVGGNFSPNSFNLLYDFEKWFRQQ